MSLPATAVWEIRATATAGNLNGGGFNAARGGTDYTLQDAAQVNGTDGTSNASTNFNSAAATFTSVMVGNYLHLISGTNGTAGWYEIVAFVDTNNVTLDRNCSTGAMTDGVFYVGGAMSLNSTLDDEMFEAAVAGNVFWIMQAAGTVSLGEAVATSVAGGVSNPILVKGYTSARGTVTTRPTIAQGVSAWTLGANWDIYDTIHTGIAGAVLTVNSGGKAVNVKATNSSTLAGRAAISSGGNADVFLFGCEGISYRGIGISTLTSSIIVEGCYAHDSDVGLGISSGAGTVAVTHSIIEGCVTAAVQVTGAKTGLIGLLGNTLYGSVNTTGIGVSLATGTTDIKITNNIISGFISGVVHADVQTVGFDDYNLYFNNDTDVTNWTKGTHDVTTDPAFTNVGQVTGTAGAFTAGNDRLVDTSKDFTALGVVANQDHIYIISGTGVTAGIYAITSITTTTNPNDTLILTPAPGADVTADKAYQITTGHNFLRT